MSSFSDKRILLVEDEFLLARQLARALAREGAAVVGCVATVAAAIDKLSCLPHVDLAILDINLAGEPVYPVAVELMRRNVPFVFLSGYGLEDRDPDFAKVPHLSKPITMVALFAALQTTLSEMSVEPQ